MSKSLTTPEQDKLASLQSESKEAQLNHLLDLEVLREKKRQRKEDIDWDQ